MSYTPGFIPLNPTLTQLADFIKGELQKIDSAFDEPVPSLRLVKLYAEPAKPRDGMVVEAASPWNPGSGDGCYIRRAGAWVKLG